MITIALIDFFLDVGSRFITNYFSGWFSTLADLGTYISAFYFPQTLLDTLSLVAYFLPLGTILTLLAFVIIIIQIKLVVSLIHFATLGLIFK